MSLENHVPSLELCKKWKEGGGRQDTEFYWDLALLHKGPIQCYFKVEANRAYFVAAPLASEMMEWMKDDRPSVFWCDDGDGWGVETYPKRGPLPPWVDNLSLPNALMQMLLERREEK
jgi:hypothetical protein